MILDALCPDLAQFIESQKLALLAPELVIGLVLIGVILMLAFGKTEAEREERAWAITSFGCVVALGYLIFQGIAIYLPPGVGLDQLSEARWLSVPVMYKMFQADLFSLLVRMMLVFGTLLTVSFSRNFMRSRTDVAGEFYAVVLTALLGGMFLAGARDLIMLFVALETLGVSSYIMVGYFRNNYQSAEAALKYLVYGGMATAILLYGFSLLYGLTGQTDFEGIMNRLPMADTNYLLLAVASVMVLGGFAFKLSVAPFHMWAPDVYEGAPTPVTAFLSVVSKTAGFAVAIRFLTMVMGSLSPWTMVLAWASVASMTIGNFVAVTQKNIKRLLAYSTIAHAGYMLLGLVVMNYNGIASIVYYLLAYLLMNLGAFAIIVYFSQKTGRDDIAAYAGLVRKRPTLALIFTIFLMSLAGMPITAGFFGKFFLFQALAQGGPQHLWLVIVALLNSTVSMFYYLNIVRLMLIAEPSDAVEQLSDESSLGISPQQWSPTGLVLVICLFGTVVLGLLAEPVMNISRTSIRQMERMYPYAASVKTSKTLADATAHR